MTEVNTQSKSQFIGTANIGFAQRAQEELRRLVPHIQFKQLVPGEVFSMSTTLSPSEFIVFIKGNEPIFLRHLQPIHTQLFIEGDETDIQRYAGALDKHSEQLTSKHIAVQIRKAPASNTTYGIGELRHSLQTILVERYGVKLVAHSADWILSIYIIAGHAFIGLSRPADNLSDWSGGAIRFKKEAGQVSRSKFKLLEAEIAFSLDFASFQRALDIGAAPGGWTSLLLERGLEVTAVDPARLHPSLIPHPKLNYIQSNAEDVTFPPSHFDLLVCDMSWSPRQMTRLITALLPALCHGGIAIITGKLMHGNAFQTIRDITNDFKPHLQLVKAKQLFHNRQEVTMYFSKLS